MHLSYPMLMKIGAPLHIHVDVYEINECLRAFDNVKAHIGTEAMPEENQFEGSPEKLSFPIGQWYKRYKLNSPTTLGLVNLTSSIP